MAKQAPSDKQKQPKKKWYRSNIGIIALIILFFPVGIYLMWRYSNWKKWLKITLSAIYGFFTLVCVIAALNPQPYIAVDNINGGTVKTDNKTYQLTGSLSGIVDNVKVTVNDKPTERDGSKFTATLELKDGDNPVIIKSSVDDKTQEKRIVIYKTPEAELQARRDAEAKRKAEEAEAAKKKAADAAAKQKATDEKKQAESSKSTSNPSKSTQPTQPKQKSSLDKLWEASDQVLGTRKGVDIKFDATIGTAQLFYTPDSIWDEKRAVQMTYKNFVNWGKKVNGFEGVQAIDVYTKSEFTDSYGKSSTDTAVRVLMDVGEFRKYNWESLEGQPIHNQLERDGMLYLHPAIRKNVNLNDTKLFL